MSFVTPRLSTARDVVEFLNVRVTRVYELVDAPQIPFTKVGVRQLGSDPLVTRQLLDARTTRAQESVTEEQQP